MFSNQGPWVMHHLTAGPAALARLATVVPASPPALTLVPLHHERHRLVEGRADHLVDSAARLGSRRQVDNGQVAVLAPARLGPLPAGCRT